MTLHYSAPCDARDANHVAALLSKIISIRTRLQAIQAELNTLNPGPGDDLGTINTFKTELADLLDDAMHDSCIDNIVDALTAAIGHYEDNAYDRWRFPDRSDLEEHGTL